jgi:hypothetical protein
MIILAITVILAAYITLKTLAYSSKGKLLSSSNSALTKTPFKA